MSNPIELVAAELDAENGQLLPDRSAMAFFQTNFSKVDVWADAKAFGHWLFWSDIDADNDVDIDVDQDNDLDFESEIEDVEIKGIEVER